MKSKESNISQVEILILNSSCAPRYSYGPKEVRYETINPLYPS